MMLADVPANTTLFVDANILIFARTNHPTHGPACDAEQLQLGLPHRQDPGGGYARGRRQYH